MTVIHSAVQKIIRRTHLASVSVNYEKLHSLNLLSDGVSVIHNDLVFKEVACKVVLAATGKYLCSSALFDLRMTIECVSCCWCLRFHSFSCY